MTFQLEIDHVREKNRAVQDLPTYREPDFATYEPDLEVARELVDAKDYEALVVVGNGGSITSFRALLYAFLPEVDVDVRMVTTNDPDYLNRLHKELDPENTIVMPVSKSGETATVIESTLYFMKRGYEILPLTSDNDGALRKIAEKRNLDWVEHPPLGGRFSGAAETALVPAEFAGIEASEVRRGAEEMYAMASPEESYNPALNFASAVYDAEQKGYDNLFAPFYSSRMFGYYPLFVQLMHETGAKDGKGVMVSGDHGPEFQHHTNQRIFGGPEDVMPVFFLTENHEEERMEVPEDLKKINLRGKKIGDLEGKSMQDLLHSEYKGVKGALEQDERPFITVKVTELSHRSAGKIMAFMQYAAVYYAWLNDVDPFTQPDVEKAKTVGWESRFTEEMT